VPGLRVSAAPDAAAAPVRAQPGPQGGTAVGVAAGSAAMVCVGGSVAVSSVLAGAPACTAEAVRYGAACLLLVALARLTGRRLARPRGVEWLWPPGIAVTGLVVFNLALVEGSRHAEPAVLGVAVACVPAVLALIGPLLEGTRPRTAAVAAALVVTCGAGLVQGLGRTDAIGVAWPSRSSAARLRSPCWPFRSSAGTDRGASRCTPPGSPRRCSPCSGRSAKDRKPSPNSPGRTGSP